MNFPERFFKLKEKGTTVRKEIYTGVISFLAVSYILAVNPDILGSAGMDKGGVFYATVFASFIGTLIMACYADFPLILAPAMGLNAFFAYSVVGAMGYSWQFALFAIVVEGGIFFLLSVSSIREKIINAIPLSLKYAMGAGIGLFITLIAFQNARIIKDHPATLLTIQDFFGPSFHTAGISGILALTGVLFTAYLMQRKVAGALLFGILGTWLLGIICQLAGIYKITPENGFYSLLPAFDTVSFTAPFHGFCDLFGAAFDVGSWRSKNSGDTGVSLLYSADFAIISLSFLFADFFDTVGTINGTLIHTPLMEKNGNIPRVKKLLVADSLATLFGGILGTSTTTTFAESAVGINAGGRSGLSALTGAVLFLLSLVFAPVFLAIPGFATAPALIVVGFFMCRAMVHIHWEDIAEAIPAFLLIVGIAFTYSISDGLGLGIISYTVLNCRIKGRVSLLMWVLALLFIAKYVCL